MTMLDRATTASIYSTLNAMRRGTCFVCELGPVVEPGQKYAASVQKVYQAKPLYDFIVSLCESVDRISDKLGDEHKRELAVVLGDLLLGGETKQHPKTTPRRGKRGGATSAGCRASTDDANTQGESQPTADGVGTTLATPTGPAACQVKAGKGT